MLDRLLELSLQFRDPLHDPSPVGLQLGLTRSPGQDPGTLLGHGLALAPEPGQVVAEQGQLDLDRPDPRRGVLGEDVEDQRFSVDDVALEELLQVALLRRGELVVEDHEVDVQGPGQRGQLARLPGADERGRVDLTAAHQFPIDGLGAGGVGEQLELVEAALGLDRRSSREARRRPGRRAEP